LDGVRARPAALHWAALCAEPDPALECLQLLGEVEDLSPLLNVQSSSGSTPLHCAVTRGHIEAVRLLVQKGADLALKDEDGLKAADIAKGRKDLEKALKNKK